MIITIARQCGCEGDEVGRKLSEIYGIPCYSKKELIELAKEKKVYDKYPFYFGERQVDDMMSMVADDMNLKVRETPKKALSALFEDQPCIVIGRASDYAYKEHPGCCTHLPVWGQENKNLQNCKETSGIRIKSQNDRG